MRRFRILFAVVAVALLVPTALLAHRALQSVESERHARHQTVAERVFDEMERALSGFLATEEAEAKRDEVVREVAELVRPHVESAGFALRLDVEPDLPRVRFERDALMQALFNLVDNTVKYSDGGAPKEILLGCRRDGDALRLTVRDRGPGVPAPSLRRIFEPFYPAENELTRRQKGTGIGLALVRGLVEAMGAQVSGRNLPVGGFEVEIAFRSAAAR